MKGAVQKAAAPTTTSRSNNLTKAAAAKTKPQPAAVTAISSDEEQDDDLDIPSDFDELMEDVLDANSKPQPQPAALLPPSEPPIPAPLLARLLHEHFDDKDTQIQKGAMDLFGSYMNIFVREAIARAKSERDNSTKTGVRSEGFLQVEDLEKLAPQLVLDF